ncbi:MAG: hypothetical protein KGL39_34055 [Patescibacteria group bacterium]|nr:hypothetical protein [Patescibacteria group bacterium]
MATKITTEQTAKAARRCLQRGVVCECEHWADVRMDIRLLTGHHMNCPKASDPVEAAKGLIAALVKGMENWGHDEDGIHPDAWAAYKRGKAVTGQFDWKEEEADNAESSQAASGVRPANAELRRE